MKNELSNLSKILRSARIQAGKTQVEISAELDIERSSYGAYETGQNTVPASMIGKLATALDIPAYIIAENIPDKDGIIAPPSKESLYEIRYQEYVELIETSDELKRLDDMQRRLLFASTLLSKDNKKLLAKIAKDFVINTSDSSLE